MALILGVNYLTHDGCFSLLKDGELLAVYEVERFNQTKLGREVEPQALDAILSDFGYTPADIDHVSFSYHPAYMEVRKEQTRQLWQEKPWQAQSDIDAIEWMMETSRIALGRLVGGEEKIIPVRHHLAHLAGVYYPSGCETAAIISIDGIGEAESTVIALGQGDEINILRHNQFPNSLGLIYYCVTEWLGWYTGEEGKTMALASYGKPTYLSTFLDEFIDLSDDGFFTCKNYPTPKAFLNTVFGPARQPHEELTQRHKDMAATVQQLTNEILVRLARYTKKIAPVDTLIITGGVALNSVANGKVLREGIFKNLLAYPHANDTGVAIGGALWLERHVAGNRTVHKMKPFAGAYWGRRMDMENLPGLAAKFGLNYQTVDAPELWAAERIADGKIVGWIQGRAELGPRALGNRSILANACRAETKDTINAKIKNREMWRPFAPSVLAEDTSIYFEADQNLPYMIIVADVRKEWREKLAAVTHVDGTARVQSVEQQVNPRYHALLSALKEQTGVGMVLNTSFNDRGEPIVNTVEQALRLFLRSDMDALVIGNHVFEAKPEGNRDRTAFSAFLYSLPRHTCAHAHVMMGDFGAPLSRYKPFFEQAAQYLASLSFDSSVPRAEIAELVGDIPDTWKWEEISSPCERVFLLGAEYGAFWLLRKAVCQSPALEQARKLASSVDAVAYGVDCNGGFTDLEFVRSVGAAAMGRKV